MKKLLPWAVSAALAGVAVYAIATGKLDADNGKFLGVVEESAGLGVDDLAKGAVILAAAVAGGKLIKSVLHVPAAV